MIYYVYYNGRRTNLTVEGTSEYDAATRARDYVREVVQKQGPCDPNEIRISRHEPKHDTPHAGKPFSRTGGRIPSPIKAADTLRTAPPGAKAIPGFREKQLREKAELATDGLRKLLIEERALGRIAVCEAIAGFLKDADEETRARLYDIIKAS